MIFGRLKRIEDKIFKIFYEIDTIKGVQRIDQNLSECEKKDIEILKNRIEEIEDRLNAFNPVVVEKKIIAMVKQLDLITDYLNVELFVVKESMKFVKKRKGKKST
jgi:hypothetical protein